MHGDKHAIVTLADNQRTYGDHVKSDDCFKMREAGSATVLVSGSRSDAEEMVVLLRPVIDAYDAKPKLTDDFDLRIGPLKRDIEVVVRQRKKSMVEQYLSMRYNVSYEEFYNSGKNAFPIEIYTLILKEIGDLSIGCEVIIAYIEDEYPIVFTILSNGRVEWSDNYSCIGNGSTIATAILCQNDWDTSMSLEECLVRLYSAKYAAHKNSYVGSSTSFDILIQGSGWYDLTQESFDYVRRRRIKFATPKNLAFPSPFLTKGT